MLTSPQLLAILQKSSQIPPEDKARLRQLYEHAPQEFTPRVMVKWLVARGRLTREQGARLLASDPMAPGPMALAYAAGLDMELELAPLEGEHQEAEPDDEQFVAPLDDPALDDELTPPEPLEISSELRQELAERRDSSKAAIPPLPHSSRHRLFDEVLSTRQAASATLPPKQRRKGRGRWDSPLMMVGGGTLLVLVVVGVALLWLLNRRSGDEVLRAAENDYRDGAYSQAIHKYDAFLDGFADHPSASLARIHRGLAQLRLATEDTADWPRALATASEVLPAISQETRFADAHAELAAMLPAIAEGLANTAAESQSSEQHEQAGEALAMLRKYVPSRLWPLEKVRAIEASLALTRRQLDRGTARDRAIAAIEAAIASARPHDAYAAQQRLLASYPELVDDDALRAAMQGLAEVEKQAVHYEALGKAAITTDHSPTVEAAWALATHTGKEAPTSEEALTGLLADGAAYGIDGGSGKVLWRRFVGFDSVAPPRVVKTGGDEAMLLHDAHRNEFVVVDGRSGALRWRQPMGETAADSRATASGIAGIALATSGPLLVAARDGRVLKSEVQSGELQGAIHLPMGIDAPPAIGPRQRLCYQLASHSNLFVLDIASGTCHEVVQLGHAAGSMPLAPLFVGSYLLLVENHGAASSRLRVLQADAQGLNLRQVQAIELVGRVTSSPRQISRTLAVVTDLGAIYVLEITPDAQDEPLRMVASRPTSDGPPQPRPLLLSGDRLWVGGAALGCYELQLAASKLAPQRTLYEGDTIVSLEALGETLVVARADRRGGTLLSALDSKSGQHDYWECHVAAPLAAPPVVRQSDGALVAMTVDGTGYALPADQAVQAEQPFSSVVRNGQRIGDEHAALERHEPAVLVEATRERPAALAWRPAPTDATAASGNARLSSSQLQLVDLQTPLQGRRLNTPGDVVAPPAAWQGNLLVPLGVGQLAVLDPANGEEVLGPFQPPLALGERPSWTAPEVFGEQIVIGDGQLRLFRLEVREQPSKHLAAAAEAQLASPPTSPLAALGEAVYLVDAADTLQALALADLSPGAHWQLSAPLVWGPRRVGSHVLLASDGQLLCLDGKQQLRWQTDLPLLAGGSRARVTGAIELDSSLIVATQQGDLLKIGASDGHIAASHDVGQPLQGDPVVWRDRLVVTGHDGTIYQLATDLSAPASTLPANIETAQ